MVSGILQQEKLHLTQVRLRKWLPVPVAKKQAQPKEMPVTIEQPSMTTLALVARPLEITTAGLVVKRPKKKNRLEKHTRKKHIAANKQTNKSCERTAQESNPFKVQRHKEEIEGKGHKPEIAEVNHEAEKKDIIEGESVAHDNDKAFETTRENTPHSLGNEK